MKIEVLVVVCALVASSAAFPGCCIPSVLQGNVWIGNTFAKAMALEYFFYDFQANMARFDVLSEDKSGITEATILIRGDLQMVYEIYPNGTCFQQKDALGVIPACLPRGGLEDSVIIGGELETTVITYPGFNFTSDFMFAHNCVPVSGTFFDRYLGEFVPGVQINYYNLKEEIVDPLIFEAPTGCSTTNAILGESLYKRLGRTNDCHLHMHEAEDSLKALRGVERPRLLNMIQQQ